MRAVRTLLVLVALLGVGLAQEPANKPPDTPRPPQLNAAYRLDYVIAEVENGKKVNTRTYTLMIDESGEANTHMGMRVPVQTEKGVTYMDVGLRIDAKLRPRQIGTDVLWLSTRFEVSSLADQSSYVSGAAPPLRNVEFSTATTLTPGKSVVLSAGDELTSQKRFELSVTVTKIR